MSNRVKWASLISWGATKQLVRAKREKSHNQVWMQAYSYPYILAILSFTHPGSAPGGTRISHWGRDKMTTFSRAFSSMKIVVFWLNFHWNMFARIQLTIIQHWFRWWLGADQATSHYLNQWWLIYRHIYASLGLNEICKWKQWRTPCLFFVKSHILSWQQQSRISSYHFEILYQ